MEHWKLAELRFFGRMAIAQLLRAARQTRSPHGTDIPCFVYIDEAHTFIANDKNVIELFDEMRKYNVGIILAHQRVNQLAAEVLDALYHDVGTIIASRVRDAKLLVSAMHCEPSPSKVVAWASSHCLSAMTKTQPLVCASLVLPWRNSQSARTRLAKPTPPWKSGVHPGSCTGA